MKTTRRQAITLFGTAAAMPLAAHAAGQPLRLETRTDGHCGPALSGWASGTEGQRKADLGNGRFLNPIFAGDHADPAILKDGDDYYMTFTTFDCYPGLTIWHSRDLVNWAPVTAALPSAPGSVLAVDLLKYEGRYYIYIPIVPLTLTPHGKVRIYAIHSEHISGPWSEPVDIGVEGHIDPEHTVGEDGRRYLFLAGVYRVRLTDDGLAAEGEPELAYEGWQYPRDWVVQAFALEGPKVLRRGEYFYLLCAEGGTAGPPTSHMVIAARSRSIHGPWENCPHNPIVHTAEASEPWWSRGHGSLVEGPDGEWWLVYHGYENGYRTLGRQTLLEPVEWTSDGWFRATGGDLSQPLPKPLPTEHGPAMMALSDDFIRPAFGTRWRVYRPASDALSRAHVDAGALVLPGIGDGPRDCSPVVGLAGDHAYEVSVDVHLEGGVEAGLLLFFNDRLFLGMGHNGRTMTTYAGGQVSFWREPAPATRHLRMRIVNDGQIVTFFYGTGSRGWTQHGLRFEVSGYNANVVEDLASLRPAVFAAKGGAARFRTFRYRAFGA
jgi:xylan 1,4-beta-xylosidase